MAKAKAPRELSEDFIAESKAIDKAHKKIPSSLIAETKAKNSYLVIADKKGNIKKISAKDL